MGDYYPELQIRRDSENNTYTKVHQVMLHLFGTMRPQISVSTLQIIHWSSRVEVFSDYFSQITLTHPLVYVFYEVINGLNSFDVAVGANDTKPLMDTFSLTCTI